MMKRVYILLMAVFLCLVLLQTFTHIMPQRPLTGVETTQDPSLTLANFINAKFQSAIDTWLFTNIGFRETMVRLDNQISFSIFHTIIREGGTQVILGKENHLYGKGSLDYYNKLDTVSVIKLEEGVKKLKKVQTLLAKRGIASFFLIAPSKATIYPEHIEDKYILHSSIHKKSNYENLLPLLAKYNIAYIDGHILLANLKKNQSYPVFTKAGYHWSYQAAFIFTQQLVKRMAILLKTEMSLKSNSEFVSKVPFRLDGELADLTNFFTPQVFYEKEYRYPSPENQDVASSNQKNRPSIFIVGDSFCTLIIEFLTHAKICDVQFSYYFNTYERFVIDENKRYELLADGIKVFKKYPARALNGVNFVIIENNEERLASLGYGYLEALLEDPENRVTVRGQ